MSVANPGATPSVERRLLGERGDLDGAAQVLRAPADAGDREAAAAWPSRHRSLVRELLREGADARVLAYSTVDSDALRAAVEPYTLQHSAHVADVCADELAALAAIQRAGRLAIETGTGITMSADANVNLLTSHQQPTR